MLRLKHLRMTNFGIHERIDQSLDGSIIGLSGLNGSGKSTVLQAIQYALTGKIDHDDNLSDFIRRVGKKTPKSATVELDFEVDGKPAKISRTITRTSTSREFHWEGKVLTADAAVSVTMRDLLGVDAKAINSTVFIRQGSFMDLFAGDTERMEFYTKLLMLQHLDKIADIVDSHRKRVAEKVRDLGPVRDASEQAYNAARDAYDEAAAALAEFADRSSELRHYAAILGKYSELERYAEEERTAKATSENAQQGDAEAMYTQRRTAITRKAELEPVRDAWNTFALRQSYLKARVSDFSADAEVWQQIDETDERIAEVGPPADTEALERQTKDLTTAIDAFSAIDRANAEIARLEPLVESTGQRLAKGKAELPDVQAKHQTARDEAMRLRGDVKLLKDLLSVTNGHACDGGCVVCGNKTPDATFMEGRLKTLETDLVPAEALLTEMHAKLVSFTDGIATLDARLAGDTKLLEAQRKALGAATVTALAYESKEAAEAKVREHIASDETTFSLEVTEIPPKVWEREA